MYRFVTIVLLLALVLAPELLQAQVTGETGKLGFQLSTYGRVRIKAPDYTTGLQQLDRASPIVALDSSAVFDYNDDAENVSGPDLITGGVSDVMATVMTDNSYSALPPNVHVRVTVYGWNSDSFLLYRFSVRNDSSAAVKAYIATAVVPKPSNSYGEETMAYDATKKVAYYYRSGEPGYTGFKVVSGDPYSFHSIDWDVYSSDPGNEVTTDAMRCFLTTPPGFDAPFTAGVDGGFMHMTAGSWTIQPGDSAVATFALLYSDSLNGILTDADAAQARYNSISTSVKSVSNVIPESYQLRQNYPNPFNPSTQIGFDVPREGFVSLKVYNLLGQEVATLVRETLAPGSYSTKFSGDGLPSGFYIARLEAREYVSTLKMLLMK
jgi:hypothetical protein